MKYALFICVVLLLGSCKIQAPEYKRLESWQLNSVSFDKITLANQIVLNNPNSLKGIKLKKLHVTFDVDSKNVGELVQDYNMDIPARADFNLPITVQLKTGNSLLAALSNVLTGSINNMEVSVNGFAECKYFLFKRRVPIQYRQKINIEQLLKTNK